MWLSLSIRLFLSFNRIAANWFASRAKTVWSHDSPLHVVLYKSSETCTIAFYEAQIPSPLLLLVLPRTKQGKPSTCWSRRWTTFRRSVNFGHHGVDSGAGTKTLFTSNCPERPRQNY